MSFSPKTSRATVINLGCYHTQITGFGYVGCLITNKALFFGRKMFPFYSVFLKINVLNICSGLVIDYVLIICEGESGAGWDS